MVNCTGLLNLSPFGLRGFKSRHLRSVDMFLTYYIDSIGNMKKKVLILGSFGFIGQSLVDFFDSKNFEVIAGIRDDWGRLPVKKVKLDITSLDRMSEVLSEERPDILINTSGLTGFSKCDSNPKDAKEKNTEGVKILIKAASFYKPLFVQLSTDAVFSGDEGLYAEDDVTHPNSVYGKTKLEAEKVLKNSSLPFLIIRTSAVYGNYKYLEREKRFIDNVLSSLIKRERFEVMVDVFNSPTFLGDFCEGLFFLIDQEESGVFHLCGNDRSSKYDLALKIAKEFGLSSEKIEPVKSDSSPFFSLYPKDTSLSSGKIKSKGYMPCGVDEGLKRCVQERQL